MVTIIAFLNLIFRSKYITKIEYKYNFFYDYKTSYLYGLKEELIQMLNDTFPLFEVSLEKHGERYDLDEDEFNICVSWKKYRHNNKN